MAISKRISKPTRLLNLFARLIFVYVLGVTMLMPFSGDFTGLNPISSAWGQITDGCDSDGDGWVKDSGKCRNKNKGLPIDCDDSKHWLTDDCGDEPPVDPGSCNLDFEANFRDLITDPLTDDGLIGDGQGTYVAAGGTGFRLDTNGSIKLERKNDTRFVIIDFEADELCIEGASAFPAAGFCTEPKGIDLRFEHQVQELPGLCSLDANSNPTMRMVVGVAFEADPGHTLGNTGQNGNGATTLVLSYGCLGSNTPPGYASEVNQALVTRLDEFTWTIEGERACLTTHSGNTLTHQDGGETVPVWLNMPFLITIVDVNAPE